MIFTSDLDLYSEEIIDCEGPEALAHVSQEAVAAPSAGRVPVAGLTQNSDALLFVIEKLFSLFATGDT